RTGMPVDFRSTGSGTVRLAEEAELALFRALQEGLSNVARHAKASRATVVLVVGDGDVLLAIEDDGQGLAAGFDLEALGHAGHMGLAGMQERVIALGGEMRISSGDVTGARLRVRVPMQQEDR